MKPLLLVSLLIFKITAIIAQPLPHGMVYGQKPDLTGLCPAAKLQTYMGKRTRVSITISGRVSRVNKTKGGWFVLDAGNGHEINAHFIDNNVSIPQNLQGHNIIAEGAAQKQFVAADRQHFAGDTPKGKEQQSKSTPHIDFEVKGLMVN